MVRIKEPFEMCQANTFVLGVRSSPPGTDR